MVVGLLALLSYHMGSLFLLFSVTYVLYLNIFPLDLGLRLPEDDSLRLLIEITEEMDYRELHAAYERHEAAGEATAKQLFQLVVFGFMNG